MVSHQVAKWVRGGSRVGRDLTDRHTDMMRVLAMIGLIGLAVAVAITTVLVIMLQNFTGAPQPDGEALTHQVSSDGSVIVDAGQSYEFGAHPDREDPAYRGGTVLADPECVITDPAGQPLEILDQQRAPNLNFFTRYGRFVSADAGTYRVTCRDVLPVKGTLVVVTDVWETHRATEAQRRQRNAVTGAIGGLGSTVALGGAIWVGIRRPRRVKQ